MSFTSFQFILFFGIVYIVNWILFGVCENTKIYKFVLLLESYVFLYISDLLTVLSLMFFTLICYIAAIGIRKYRENIFICKVFFILGLCTSIGPLCLFKYYDFIVENVCRLLNLRYIQTILYVPLGISFFTFSAIAYLVDIYKNKYEIQGNLFDFAVYMAYFPKFISGPIVRPDRFDTQVQKGVQCISINSLQTGVQYVAWGLFKKMVIADHLAIFVDDVFTAPSAFHSVTCIWAMLSYSLQIYFDFSGYSDLAIGFSKMLGIDIDRNFNLPYISKNVTEFWNRWHISLSSWLRDYIYISFGGNRKGKIRTQINLILTMLIGGLWHGAAWTFIVWGGIHGAALVIHKRFKVFRSKFPEKIPGKTWSVISSVITFVYITFTWVIFRADSLAAACEMFWQALSLKKGVLQIYSWTWLAIAFMICEIIYAAMYKRKHKTEQLDVAYPILELNTIRNLMLFFILVGMTVILAYVGNTAFIYGRF